MEVGVDVWIKDEVSDHAWLPGVIAEKSWSNAGWLIVATTDDGKSASFKITSDNEEELSSLKLRNLASESSIENLINLPYLHEPAILYCLQERFYDGDIYTYTGPILISVNPFKKLPLYSSEKLQIYYNSGLLKSQGVDVGSPLPPHVYAIADAAYRAMMSAIHSTPIQDTRGKAKPSTFCDQSILISGESGAGKTESTKIVLKYLTTVGNSSTSVSTVLGSVMDKILQSNPILEAFGNAKTLRNDNSSRFGKYIELYFNKRGTLIGGSICTYLLEKVRIPSQQPGERGFHIFYQLLTGSNNDEKQRWGLNSIESFEFISKGGVSVLKGIDDAAEFSVLKSSMETLNFGSDKQSAIFDTMAAILHLGQVHFLLVTDSEGEGCKVSDDEKSMFSLRLAASLLGVPLDELIYTLNVRVIVAHGESYTKKLTPQQATDARDALCKAMYGKIFDFIVRSINSSIEVDRNDVRAKIGVLDIFGFECFKNNSFEQLCINYTNETLQQQFNQYIFKLEQQEYHLEQIEWSFIEFPDNKDCLELIEHKTTGILAMIDDECRLPMTSDERLAGKLYKTYVGKHSRFSVSSAQRVKFKFCINHYAGAVEYSTLTFVDKNKDELPKEATNLLRSSSVILLSSLFDSSIGPDGSEDTKPQRVSGGKSANSVQSVGSQFKEQLQSLMDNIRSTTPHYIRCLKPNDLNQSDNFNRLRITEQLRYGGVLEAVRVARSGFPVRLLHGEFFMKYRLLISCSSKPNVDLPRFISHSKGGNHKSLSSTLVECLWQLILGGNSSNVMTSSKSISKQSIQIGVNKVFLRKEAHDLLEQHRFKALCLATIKIQSTYRCFVLKSHYQQYLWAIRLVQRVTRGMLSRKRARSVLHNTAALKIQRIFRGYRCWRDYNRFLTAVTLLQANYRRALATKKFGCLKETIAAGRIQRNMLRWHYFQRFVKFRSAILTLQSSHRAKVARKELKRLRAESKDIGKLKLGYELLQQEIQDLRKKAVEVKGIKELENLRAQIVELTSLLNSEKRVREETELKLSNLKTLSISNEICTKCNEWKSKNEHLLKNEQSFIREIDSLRLEISDLKENLLKKNANSRRNSAAFPNDRSNIFRQDEARMIVEGELLKIRQSSVDHLSLESRRLSASTTKEMNEQEKRSKHIPHQRPSIHESANQKLEVANAPETSNTWNSTWDDEDDSSEASGSANDLSASSSNAKSIQELDKIQEKNLFQMKEGFRVKLWDGSKGAFDDCTMKMEPEKNTFTFVFPQSFSRMMFRGPPKVNALNIEQIVETKYGAVEIKDESLQKVILSITANENGQLRKIIMRFSSSDECRGFASKLSVVQASAVLIQDLTDNAPLKNSSRRPSIKKNDSDANEIVKAPILAQAIPGAVQSRATRRLSMRQAVLHESASKQDKVATELVTLDIPKSKVSAENSKQEKDQKDKLRNQFIFISNELAARDVQIEDIRKQNLILQQQLEEKDKLYTQDSLVRLQLGKRLEQVLMDKEDALEQIEQLKAQLAKINYPK